MLFRSGCNDRDPVYTYQLYLPGNAVLENCFLSWDGEAQATVNNTTYASGACPIPPKDTATTYVFKNGNQTLASFNLITYQGSPNVTPVFIDIDESDGKPTISQMDGDASHNVTCTGNINIDGTWYDMPKIKGRGNATWSGADDKRPYNVTLDIKKPSISD